MKSSDRVFEKIRSLTPDEILKMDNQQVCRNVGRSWHLTDEQNKICAAQIRLLYDRMDYFKNLAEAKKSSFLTRTILKMKKTICWWGQSQQEQRKENLPFTVEMRKHQLAIARQADSSQEQPQTSSIQSYQPS